MQRTIQAITVLFTLAFLITTPVLAMPAQNDGSHQEIVAFQELPQMSSMSQGSLCGSRSELNFTPAAAASGTTPGCSTIVIGDCTITACLFGIFIECEF